MSLVLHPVTSSTVTHIGHDPVAREMHVRWKSGKVSIYEDVPAAVMADVRKSHSIGKAIRSDVIPAYRHRYRE